MELRIALIEIEIEIEIEIALMELRSEPVACQPTQPTEPPPALTRVSGRLVLRRVFAVRGVEDDDDTLARQAEREVMTHEMREGRRLRVGANTRIEEDPLRCVSLVPLASRRAPRGACLLVPSWADAARDRARERAGVSRLRRRHRSGALGVAAFVIVPDPADQVRHIRIVERAPHALVRGVTSMHQQPELADREQTRQTTKYPSSHRARSPQFGFGFLRRG